MSNAIVEAACIYYILIGLFCSYLFYHEQGLPFATPTKPTERSLWEDVLHVAKYSIAWLPIACHALWKARRR